MLGELYGGLENLREAHGSEPRDGGRPRIDGRGNGGGQVAVARDQVYAVLAAPFDGERLWRPPHAGDGVGLALPCGVDQRRHLAADSAALRLQQRLADAHGRSRVNGVAAVHQHSQSDRSDEVVTGRHHAPPSHDYGPGYESRHVGVSSWVRPVRVQFWSRARSWGAMVEPIVYGRAEFRHMGIESGE